MKVLSIRQPWAWLIIHGYKDVENRSWATNYRGDLLIHASKTYDSEAIKRIHSKFPTLRVVMPQQKKDYKLGGLIGKVTLVDCTDESKSLWFNGAYGWIFEYPTPMEFIQYKGRRGLFEIENTIIIENYLKQLADTGYQKKSKKKIKIPWLNANILYNSKSKRHVFEFIGYVESKSDKQWIISHITVLINKNTVIDKHIQLKDRVKVKGYINKDNNLLASEITLEKDPPIDPPKPDPPKPDPPKPDPPKPDPPKPDPPKPDPPKPDPPKPDPPKPDPPKPDPPKPDPPKPDPPKPDPPEPDPPKPDPPKPDPPKPDPPKPDPPKPDPPEPDPPEPDPPDIFSPIPIDDNNKRKKRPSNPLPGFGG